LDGLRFRLRSSVLSNPKQGPGEGSSYQPNPGRYYLKVNAVGNWSMEITEESEQTSPPPNQQDQRALLNEDFRRTRGRGISRSPV
jgi:hypothetical protein